MSVATRVLCLDDDELVLRSIARALGVAPDLVVEATSDIEEARRRVVNGEYAVLVTDYEMPGEDGIAFIESIEARCDVVPVLLTAHTDFDVALGAIHRGHVYAFLQKPFRAQELIATVRRAAERFELGRALHRKVAELERANAELSVRNAEGTPLPDEDMPARALGSTSQSLRGDRDPLA